jgi:hypothetical protein
VIRFPPLGELLTQSSLFTFLCGGASGGTIDFSVDKGFQLGYEIVNLFCGAQYPGF